MSRGKSSFSGSFLQNQEYTKDTLGRCWGTDTGYTDERERVSASPFPSAMLSALYRPGSPQGLGVQPGHPRQSPVVVQGGKQPWPRPSPTPRAGQGLPSTAKAPSGPRTSWFSFPTLDTEMSVGGEGQPLGESVQTLSSPGEGYRPAEPAPGGVQPGGKARARHRRPSCPGSRRSNKNRPWSCRDTVKTKPRCTESGHLQRCKKQNPAFITDREIK